MIGNVVQLRPHDVRWVAAKGPLGWVIRDTWNPGDFCMGYKTETRAKGSVAVKIDERFRDASMSRTTPQRSASQGQQSSAFTTSGKGA